MATDEAKKKRKKKPEVNGGYPPDVEHYEPEVETVSGETVYVRHGAALYWPEKPMPAVYVKRRMLPCPNCRRVTLDTGSQAVVTKAIAWSGKVAYLGCRKCGHAWQLPVREV